MLLDNDGDAIFIYTPPSLRSSSVARRATRDTPRDYSRKHSPTTAGGGLRFISPRTITRTYQKKRWTKYAAT